MSCCKHFVLTFVLILIISASTFAQDLLPLSGDPSEPEWDGREKGTPYKVKPFEIQPRPKKGEEQTKANQTPEKPIENQPEINKKDENTTSDPIEEIKKEPTPIDENWIKGEFFGFESISDDQPGFYGIYNGGNLNASIILAEGGYFTFEHPDSSDLDRNFGFGKLYLQVDIPIVDYWMFQIGIGALTCLMFDTDIDTILSNIDVVNDSTKYGWMLMGGTSVLFELSKYMGLVPWGQFFYGNAGFNVEKYTFVQIKAGLRYVIQVSQRGIFAIFFGPALNSISISYDDEAADDVTKSSSGLAIEGGFFIANAIMLRVMYGLEDSLEFRFSIGTAF